MDRNRPRPQRRLLRFLGAESGAIDDLRATGRRQLRRSLRQVRPQTAVLVATALVGVGLGALVPAALASAVDAALSGRGVGPASARLAALLAAAALTQAIGDLTGASAAASMTAGVRRRLLRQALALGPPGRHPFAAGEVLSRLAVNATSPADVLPLALTAATTALRSASGVFGLALIDPRLAVVFLLSLPVVLLLVRRFLADAAEPFLRYQQVQAGLVGRLIGAFRGVRTIRASGSVEREIARVLQPLPVLHDAGRRVWLLQGRMGGRLLLLTPALQVLVLATGGFALADRQISPGQLLAASSYVTMALGVISLADALVSLLGCQVGAGRVGEVLDTRAAVVPAAMPVPVPEGPGRLVFRGVTVRMDGNTVLDAVHLTVPGGTRVAVVGRSGSGKSTLVGLVGRLSDPDEGELLLDGVPVHWLPLSALRHKVAYAFDRPALLGSTVHETISYGRPGASRGEVIRAAEVARVDSCVRALPQGYDTPLAHAPMSGGELQRLGLARAVLADAQIMVLDDALSSLDTATEFQVSAALDDALAGRTSLVVAYRPATAARADLVVWLDRGRIRATGEHRLLWSDPAYRDLFAASSPDPQDVLATTAPRRDGW